MFHGVIKKMVTSWENPIKYYFLFPDSFIKMNDLIGKKITVNFDSYSCLSCSSNVKIYRQGFCQKCFFESPSAGDWIIRPELSKAHLNIEDRDIDFEKRVQLQPHIVYFAVSSDLKVGVTRKVQTHTRWIDQGAHQAIPIVEVPNRYLAGITEVELKKYYNDKTNWRKMLQNIGSNIDLELEREKCKSLVPDEVEKYISNQPVINICYPVERVPETVKSLNLKKNKKFTGKLLGIKGQYLIFDDNTVWNVRSHEGFVVDINVG